MNNRELFKNAFDDIAPSQELIQKVKAFQPTAHKSGIRLRKGVIIPAVIIFAACLGVTAAAVTGNIDFERIFGDRIYVADSELAEELAGSVKDVSYTVSDDEYKVSVAGVTGSGNRLYAVIEISRKDGTPVTEYLPTDDYADCCFWLKDSVKIKPAVSWGGGIGTKINSEGNIIYTADIYADSPINGSVVTAEGDTLLLNNKYLEIKGRENVYYGMQSGKWGFYSYETNEPKDVDISSAVALPLKWSIKFRYIASEKALSVLTCKSPKEKVPIYMNSSAYTECTVKNIEVSSTGGKMEIEYPADEKMHDRPVNCNEVYLIMKDGSQIPVSINGYKGWFKNGTEHKELNLEYKLPDDKFMIQYTDISEAESLNVNGVIYELK